MHEAYKFLGTWEGNDIKDCLNIVYETRTLAFPMIMNHKDLEDLNELENTEIAFYKESKKFSW